MDQATKEEIQKLVGAQPQTPRFRLSNLSLILKIGAGYATMAVFTIAALIFSSFNLYTINRTAREIAVTDLPVLSALARLRSSLLAQEGFAGRYAILKDPAFIELFRQRNKLSLANLALLEKTDTTTDVAAVKRLYLDYQAASDSLFDGRAKDTAQLRALAVRLLAALDALYFKRQDMLQGVLKRADEQRKTAIKLAIELSCLGVLLALWVAPLVTYRIFGALEKLRVATHRIAGGDLDYEAQIPQQKEISELAGDVNQMAARLKELEQMNDDALPLTRLPGNLAIERVLEERLGSGSPFAFCCANLHNFKPFIARYGYAKGSELLCGTGILLYKAMDELCSAEGFVGHVGGEEFVMVLPPGKVAAVCEAVIRSFDAEVAGHLAAEDHEGGGIQRCDRYGVQRFFPVTAISICVINCTPDLYHSAVEIAGAAADVMETVQRPQGSSWQMVA